MDNNYSGLPPNYAYCVDFFLETPKGDLFSYIITKDEALTSRDNLQFLIEQTVQKYGFFAKDLQVLENEFGRIIPNWHRLWRCNADVTGAFISNYFE